MYIQNAQIEILQPFVFKNQNQTKRASFTHVLYFSSTGHKNCDSTESHIIDTLTLLLYPILKLALKLAYFIMYLGFVEECPLPAPYVSLLRWEETSGDGCWCLARVVK